METSVEQNFSITKGLLLQQELIKLTQWITNTHIRLGFTFEGMEVENRANPKNHIP